MKRTLTFVVAVLLVIVSAILVLRSGNEDNKPQKSEFVERKRPENFRNAKISERKEREPITVTLSGFRSAWGEPQNEQ